MLILIRKFFFLNTCQKNKSLKSIILIVMSSIAIILVIIFVKITKFYNYFLTNRFMQLFFQRGININFDKNIRIF